MMDQVGNQRNQTARALGYRMPAEWEPVVRVWVTRPHNVETWPGCLPQAQQQWDAWVAAMKPYVEVAETAARGIATDDSWIRDFGPIFVVRDAPDESPPAPAGGALTQLARKALHDFHFNAWGGKYGARELDDVVPQLVAQQLRLPIWLHDMVLEGGSIDVNGAGAVMTTEQCLLNPNRNPRKNRAAIVKELHDALGTHHIIWLPGGIVGDDTDGHIDDLARFVNPTTIVAIRAPRNHPDYDMLERNRLALADACDQDGKRLDFIELPVPDPIQYDFPAGRFGRGGTQPVPASYANFLIANRGVFVPVFGQKSDEVALRILEDALPKHTIVGVRAEHLVVGLGALHCLSQQEPGAPLPRGEGGEALRAG
ncbi:MAG: agmatine deiminase family protein [Phycisphaeraceae bacterium]